LKVANKLPSSPKVSGKRKGKLSSAFDISLSVLKGEGISPTRLSVPDKDSDDELPDASAMIDSILPVRTRQSSESTLYDIDDLIATFPTEELDKIEKSYGVSRYSADNKRRLNPTHLPMVKRPRWQDDSEIDLEPDVGTEPGPYRVL
jgi:hypothetical protein